MDQVVVLCQRRQRVQLCRLTILDLTTCSPTSLRPIAAVFHGWDDVNEGKDERGCAGVVSAPTPLEISSEFEELFEI